MRYRPEIDGLRAVAVLAVLLDHAKLEFFNGGFVGVDIFFVISGFLIAFITIGDIEKQRFSIGRFYERRIRRIIPALLIVSSVTTVAAFLLLYPESVRHYVESLIAALFFAANIFFYFESNYFAQASDLELMLHTWSLGVEEQFYIFFPILFLYFYTRSKSVLLIATIFLGSLLLALSAGDENAVFYLLPYRAWEFAVGAGLAIYRYRTSYVQVQSGKVEVIATVGLALMFLAITTTPEAASPLYLIIPVLGAGLIILIGDQSVVCRRILANPVATYVGKISFSLYLWHQPVYAIARERSVEDLVLLDYLILILLVFALSHASYKLIETPFRSRQKYSKSKLARSIVGLALPILLLCPVLYAGFTLSTMRFGADLGSYVTYNKGTDRAATWSAMREPIASDKPLRIAVVGNSHAKDMVNALRYSSASDDMAFVPLIANTQCRITRRDKILSLALPRKNAYQSAESCTTRYPFLKRYADEIDGVVIAPLWYENHVGDLPSVLAELTAHQIPVLVVGNTARFNNVPGMVRNLIRNGLTEVEELNRAVSASRKDSSIVNSSVREIAEEYGSVYLDRENVVCPDSACDLTPDFGVFNLFDSGHWTLAGARQYAPRIYQSSEMQEFMRRVRSSSSD